MLALSRRYCGICRYFSNSAAQPATDSGGRTPLTGCHSVIDRPDKVSRVMPPITTMMKIMPQQNSSQTATDRALVAAAGRPPANASLALSCAIDMPARWPQRLTMARPLRRLARARAARSARGLHPKTAPNTDRRRLINSQLFLQERETRLMRYNSTIALFRCCCGSRRNDFMRLAVWMAMLPHAGLVVTRPVAGIDAPCCRIGGE